MPTFIAISDYAGKVVGGGNWKRCGKAEPLHPMRCPNMWQVESSVGVVVYA